MDEEDFKKLEDSEIDLELEKEELDNLLIESYRNIIDILKEYLDLKEEYYNIVAIWIIGTYFHSQFYSYPFLFFNAMKGSGKTRTLNLITTLSKNGEVLLAPTEAVLFRTKGTLAIDEFEGIVNKQGIESIRELLNASYKKGAKVKRMKQRKSLEGVEQVVEEFEVYRPIVMANIWGMETVLGDRCIQLILDKSNKSEITDLVEIFKEEKIVIETKKMLERCSLCRCSFSAEGYRGWNNYIKNNYTNYTNTTNNINNINCTQAFEMVKFAGIHGRDIELSLPLILISTLIGEDVLKITTPTLKNIFDSKKDEELVENRDINLIEFIAENEDNNYFITLSNLLEKFKESTGINDEWINSKWLGRALKRLNLIKNKRRQKRGVEVILDVLKAQEKIKMFK